MRFLPLSLVCVIAFPALIHAKTKHHSKDIPKVPAYEIVEVDNGKNTLTLVSNSNVITVQVRADAEIRINGVGSVFSALEPKMHAKLTLAEPGVAQAVDANGLPTTVESGAALQGISISSRRGSKFDSNTGRVFDATIAANSSDAYQIAGVRKGTKITFCYVEGKWKAWGHKATNNPDVGNNGGDERCRLAIALPSTDSGIGAVLGLVPPGTSEHPYVFEAQRDYPSLVLRINATSFTHNPGQVVYRLRIQSPADLRP